MQAQTRADPSQGQEVEEEDVMTDQHAFIGTRQELMDALGGEIPDTGGLDALIARGCKRPLFDPARKAWICHCKRSAHGKITDRMADDGDVA